MPYIDTSALVALYIPESKSARVSRALAGDEPGVISSLVEVEFFSAVSRRIRMGGLSTDDGRRVTSLFGLHMSERRYGIVPLTEREYAVARGWLARFDTRLRTLDALHLAVAYSSDLPLLTADTDLARSARKLGVPVKAV